MLDIARILVFINDLSLRTELIEKGLDNLYKIMLVIGKGTVVVVFTLAAIGIALGIVVSIKYVSKSIILVISNVNAYIDRRRQIKLRLLALSNFDVA